MTALTSFVGRAADLADLERMLEASRWIAVVGPPGVGKTRLVDEVVHAMTQSETIAPGGVWRVDLRGAGSVGDAIATIALELGIASDGGPAIAGIAAALAGRGPALVVLHEVDGVGAAIGSLVAALLDRAPHLQIATTGRSRTGADGEVCFDVHPLPLDEAVQLFASRARAVRREFSLDANLDAVRSIVASLDRLPLAIELAASRMRVMTAAQLAEQPTAQALGEDRLTAALDATWEGLAEWQRAALAQLAVFRGGFDLDAASAVVDLSGHAAPPIVDALLALCDASLVTASGASGAMRFDLLAIVREYAGRRSHDAAGAYRDVATRAAVRHAEYWVPLARRWVDELDGKDSPRARERLREERANLVAIVERGGGVAGPDTALWAAICVVAAQIRAGAYRELADFLSGPLAGVGDGFPELQAEAAWLRGEIFRQVGDLEAAAQSYARLRSIGTVIANPRLVARAGYGVAAIAFSRGDLAGAIAGYRVVVAADPPAIEVVCSTRALSDLGVIATVLGQGAEARLAFDRALREAAASGCEIGAGRAWLGLGQLEQRMGRLDDALRSFERARAIQEVVGDRRSVALAQHQVGLNHHLRRRFADASACYRAALATCDEIGHHLLAAMINSALGVCSHAEGRFDEAARQLEEGRVAFARIHPAYYAANTARLAAVWADQGDVEAARALLEQAIAKLPSTADPDVGETVATCRIHVELAGGADPAPARARIAAAEGAPIDVRLQAFVLAQRLEAQASISRHLCVGARGQWFTVDSGERIGLERRGPPSRILMALVEHRLADPKAVVKTHALFARGWPDQRATADSAAARVYTAIWTLRKLGLRDLIVRLADGYFLDRSATIEQCSE